MKKEFYSCGLNQYGQLTHGIEDGIFHEMKIPRNLQVKKMKCGRSHILVTTFDNKLYSYGANLYGQCGVGSRENLSKWTECKTNDELFEKDNIIKNVTDFSCGWSHSLCITENGTSLYFTGSSVSAFENSDYFSNINNEIPLKSNQIYTKVISGDHVCSVIIDNHIINYIDSNPILTIDVLEEIGSAINEIIHTNKGFLLTNKFGNLFTFNCMKNKERFLQKIIFNGFVKNLSAAHTHHDISYQLNNSKYYFIPYTEEKVYDVDYEIIQPLYYGALLYKRKERKLFAIGSNEDYTLGLSSKGNLEELTEVTTINEYLKKNSEMDIDEIIEGCDITVLVMKEKETKNLIFFYEALKKSISNNNYIYLNDIIFINFTQ